MVTLTATLGIPGSGKSTWATAHALETGATLVTVDAIRAGASPVHTLNNAVQLVADTLAAGADVVIDACNTNTTMRRRWLRLAWQHRATPVLHIMHTPTDLCVARNAERHDGDRVPADRMAGYVAGWQQAVSRAMGEGWTIEGSKPPASTSGATHAW